MLARLALSMVLASTVFGSGTALAQTPGPGSPAGAPLAGALAPLSGTIVDRSSGLPLAGVAVVVLNRPERATTDAQGRFLLTLPPGVYVLEARLSGYQTTDSDELALVAGTPAGATLAIQRLESSSGNLRSIGRTSTRASNALQPATVVQHSVAVSDVVQSGFTRIDQALQNLPNVVESQGLATPGNETNLQLRGLQGVTQYLIDGHPTEVAIQSATLFPFQTVNVVYGSGKGALYPINAIGGVIDLRTIQPTPQNQWQFVQSFGTFDKTATGVQLTGTSDRLGYAVSFGVDGIDAPYGRTNRYQPRGGFDPTATDPAVAARNFATVDSGFTTHSELLKAVYKLSPALTATATVIGTSELHDNEGDKSVDYVTYQRALFDGLKDLAGKNPAKDPCPAGTFTVTGPSGKPNGIGPNGQPDGGFACQTPQQFASFHSGYATGELGQIGENNNDTDLRLESNGQHYRFLVDTYGSIFKRSQLFANANYVTALGDLNDIHTKQTHDSEAGINVSDTLVYKNDEVGAGYFSNNYRQNEVGLAFKPGFVPDGGYLFTYGNDIQSLYFSLVHHPAGSPLSVYAYDYIKNSHQPNAWFNDPRVALLYRRPNDTFRLAAGVSSDLPYAPDNQTYQAVPLQQFQSGVNCGGQSSIGTAPAGYTKPERASDEDFSWTHRWSGDSFTQAELYNQNFASKVQYGYNAPLPVLANLSFTSAAAIDAYLAAYQTQCSGFPAPTIANLTLNGNYNIGRELARGVDLTGRQRATRSLFFDYSYAVQSVAYRALPIDFLQQDHRLTIGSQTFVPDSGQVVPLHTASLAADMTFRAGYHARLIGYYTGPGNLSGRQGFTRTDLALNKTIHNGALSLYVFNLFQYAPYYDHIVDYGLPLQLNQFATPGDYAQYGRATTQLYGIGPRQITLTYSVRSR